MSLFQIPESYYTPFTAEKREKLKKELEKAGESGCSFIQKPSNSSRGRGIVFMNKPEDVSLY